MAFYQTYPGIFIKKIVFLKMVSMRFAHFLNEMTKLLSEIDMAVGRCLSAMEEQEKEVREKTT